LKFEVYNIYLSDRKQQQNYNQTQVKRLSHVNPTRTFPMNKQQIILCLILSLLSPIILAAQTDNTSTTANKKVKQMEHTDVNIQNTFRINSKKLEFSPTYYQNGIPVIVLVKTRRVKRQ